MFNERQAYEEKMDAELRQWGDKIEQMRTKAQAVDGHERVELESKIEEAQKDQERAKARLDELRISPDESWRQLKKRLDKSWDEMVTSWQRTFARTF